MQHRYHHPLSELRGSHRLDGSNEPHKGRQGYSEFIHSQADIINPTGAVVGDCCQRYSHVGALHVESACQEYGSHLDVAPQSSNIDKMMNSIMRSIVAVVVTASTPPFNMRTLEEQHY